MTTIRDIAGKLGISTSTVSKGLNGAHDISDEMRQKVLDTAIELGYASKKIKSRKKHSLCVLINGMEYETPDQFGYDIVLGFKQATANTQWNIDVAKIDNSDMSKDNYDSYILKHDYQGAFMLGFNMHDAWVKQLPNTIVPTVIFDNFIHNNPKVGTVGSDNFEAMTSAINHLVSLGHTNIAFLNGNRNSQVSRNRTKAFESCLINNNLAVNPALIRYGYFVANCAHDHVPILIQNHATAILCASDLIASGVINELNRMNLRVPEDISVIGFDDIPIAARLTPALTTIRQDRKNLGKSAYLLLDGLINDVAISSLNLRSQFILRNSTDVCKNNT